MANEKRNEPSILVVENVITVTRKTVRVTPETVLSLLRRCKEIPRRADGAFTVVRHYEDDEQVMSVSWEEQDSVRSAIRDSGGADEVRELDESLAEAEAAVKALPKRETVQDLTHPEYVAPLPYGDDE